MQTGMDRWRWPQKRPSERLPRADGDGPPPKSEPKPNPKAPPCRRGWTDVGPSLQAVQIGSPVQTGMDPLSPRSQAAKKRLPRADGDGPLVGQLAATIGAAPPCRRGWTRSIRQRRIDRCGSPVQTGMDPPGAPGPTRAIGLPRADGDGPARGELGGLGLRAPPCRRGWTGQPLDRRPRDHGSPVQTGMDPTKRRRRGSAAGLPRADGDGPASMNLTTALAPAPPCRRGWTPPRECGGRTHAGSPVQTGMDPTPSAQSPPTSRLPRADGDGPPIADRRGSPNPAPPCRRGWTARRRGPPASRRGSPVQTGMDPSSGSSPRRSGRLPRADGDGPRRQRIAPFYVTAPPCRRGWTLVAADLPGERRGSPVQTGMDPEEPP